MRASSSFLLFIILLLPLQWSMAQANLLNARVPQEVGKLNEDQKTENDEDPLSYGYIDDRDVLWSKTIWERIDLDERINFPFYYPTDTTSLGKERRSLFHVIVNNLRNGNIKEVYDDDYFNKKLTYNEIINTRLQYTDSTEYQLQLFNGDPNPEQYLDTYTVTAEEIEQYLVKGTWYFNKRQGELKYRLLAIAPVARQLDYDGEGDAPLLPLFWIWYPDARGSLNKEKVFNTQNSSQPITYDNMLNSRRFNAVIYKEENVYQDREVKQYIFNDALQQLLESERIKSVIRDFEQDMWNN